MKPINYMELITRSAAASKTSRSTRNHEARQCRLRLATTHDEIIGGGKWPRAADGAGAHIRAHSRTFAERLECVLAVCKDHAFLLFVAVVTACLLMLAPSSAHAQ